VGQKSVLAIEEYIFSRYYMYQNVYLHKTTRGFETMLQAMWRRARSFYDRGEDVALVPAIREFWDAQARAGSEGGAGPTVRQYLAIEEFTVLTQIQNWTTHPDKSLGDLARRFLNRKRFAMIESPEFRDSLAPDYEGWEDALNELVRSRPEYDPVDMYCLRDKVKAKYHQPYFPEKESDEQSVKNAIRVVIEGESKPVEVSKLRDRLTPLTQAPLDRVRYYLPKDLQADAKRLRDDWK
jgi:HD superfamily phosphohydrolase